MRLAIVPGRMFCRARSSRVRPGLMTSLETDMPYHDFRQFLDTLRQQGELIDVNRPIALADVGKAMKQSYRRAGAGRVVHQHRNAFPLVCGSYFTRRKAVLPLRTDHNKIMAQAVLLG